MASIKATLAPNNRLYKGTSHSAKLVGGQVKTTIKSGFDSDGQAADVNELDDKPSLPLETSVKTYETPAKRGIEEQGEAIPTKLKDIMGGRSLARHPPSQGNQGEETGSEISRFMDDFYAKRGFFGPGGQNLKKKSVQTKGDDYFNSLESLVDKYLTQVAQKIAEKKQLEVENSQLRSLYNKLSTDINEADKTQQKLLQDRHKAQNLNANLNAEVNNLKDGLNQMNLKIENQKADYKRQLHELDLHFERTREAVENEGAALQDSTNDINLRKQSNANTIKNLEKRFLEADKAHQQLLHKHEYSAHLEDSRMQKMKDKAKILSSLMSHEDLTHGAQEVSKKTNLTKSISKILVSATQSPQKGAVTRASQNASMSIAKAHGTTRGSIDLGSSRALSSRQLAGSSKQLSKA